MDVIEVDDVEAQALQGVLHRLQGALEVVAVAVRPGPILRGHRIALAGHGAQETPHLLLR